MRKQIKFVSSLALIGMMMTSTVWSFGQQRQPAPDRVVIERTLQAPDGGAGLGPERATFEREVLMNGPQGSGGDGDFVFLATEMSFGGQIVKGAPYSAQSVTESIQTLPDGNRIINRSTAAVYRDSEGRTRREQSLRSIGSMSGGGEPAVTVFINDPVAGTSFTLDPRTQTARKMMPMRFKVSSPRAIGEGAKTGAREAEVKTREGSSEVMLQRSPSPTGEMYRVEVQPSGTVEKRSLEAGLAMGIASTRNRNARTESLGKQNIGGVDAEGTRTTVTIPAGEIGNERAIEMVSERWYSPELQVIVMTRHTDPRFGENTYQLTDINRSEPAHELFEVPAGYTIKEPPTPPAVPGGINGGVLNGKAISLPLPQYPEVARQAKASGTVTVQIVIDEEGNVISAQGVSGHPLLQSAALAAAKQARFSPTKLNGQGVKVNGVLVYNFTIQ